MTNYETLDEHKRKVLDLFINNYIKNYDIKHVLGMILCGSFKNDDNNDFSDIDIQVIMDESFNEDSNINQNGGNILRSVELIEEYRFEFFVRNIQGYYYEAKEAYKQQKNALLTIIGCGQIFFYTNEESLKQIKNLQEFIIDLYSNPLPILDVTQIKCQLLSIYNDIDKLIRLYNHNCSEFAMFYFLILEKIRKFYSRSIGCCYLPPAKIWRIYQDKEYADRFCKSKIPDNEFISIFKQCIMSDANEITKIKYVKFLIEYCENKLELERSDVIKCPECKDDKNNSAIDKDEMFELIVILENRRLKLREKYFNKKDDFEYFYFIVLQMIDNFCLKINNSIPIIDNQYLNFYYLAQIANNPEDKYIAINTLLDYVKEKCEELYTGKINPLHYRVYVKPTTWSSNRQSRF